MVKNLKLLDKALQLLPEVKETVVEPLDIAAFLKPLKKGDSVEIDFGRHLVGLPIYGARFMRRYWRMLRSAR